ncbi:DUF3703 domain-containing protein [Oscillatoria amoena NRMC-F 0135]|jgi:hypothetical protein|nr:MAG: DUF3703 domain-containing protein [Bacteroidota bacterium]MDL5046955.1 DUF3703 domain-containing protein [Oscillatoria amoena NRMC-F 0135]
MKLYTKMPTGLKEYFKHELSLARQYFSQGQLQQSWHHLERAHILGQPWPIPHTQAHWRMMRFAFKIKNVREILGQIPRLVIGGIKSFVGEIPVGNTGGANVPPLKPMDIPEDLQKILNTYKV